MNLATTIWNLLIGTKKKDRILTQLDTDVEESKKIKELTKYSRSLEAQISKTKADKRAKQTEQKDITDDIDLIKKLEERSREIENKKYKGSYDLSLLFRRLMKDPTFAKKLEISDKDDKKVFDKFKTLRILTNGNIAMQGKSGEIWAEGPTLRDIIYKPESLRNQIRRGRILTPYDENFKYIPDLEMWTIPELSYDETDDSYHESEERRMNIKEKFIELDGDNRKLREDKAHLEQTIAGLRNKLQDMELAKKKWQSQSENSQSELSLVMDSHGEIVKKLGQLDRDVVSSQEQKQIAEDRADKIEDANKKMLDELEEQKSKTSQRMARDENQRDIEWARKTIPKEVHTTVVEESPKEIMVKPGEKLGKK